MNNERGERSLYDALAYEETLSCVQCGYCLPVCPTYETMGKESQSPRGRIQLVKSTAEGKLTELETLAAGIDNCLGCRACETACPTGVRYGRIFEAAKQVLAEQREPSSRLGRIARKLLLEKIVPKRSWLNVLTYALFFAQRTGMLRALRVLRLDRLLPEALRVFVPALPRIPSPTAVKSRRRLLARAQGGEEKPLIAFFTGCVMDVMYAGANDNSMELLRQAGCDVVVLKQATCCGALHAHSGDMRSARKLAQHNIETLEQLEKRIHTRVDYVVNAAGGCGAMLQEYEQLFVDDAQWLARARQFSARSLDWTELLSRLRSQGQTTVQVRADQRTTKQNGLPTSEAACTAAEETVTYQPSCHMTHVQKNRTAPLALIRSVPGVRFVAMDEADMCCGSAGTYNLVRHRQSMDLLERKMRTVKQTNAETVLVTNPGCLLQMQLGICREQLDDRMRVMHLADWLQSKQTQANTEGGH